MKKDIRPVLRAGELAYYDGIRAIIPCKVISIRGESGAPGSASSVRIKTTGVRNGWPRGTEFDCFSNHVIPRAAFHPRKLGARISYYTVEVDRPLTGYDGRTYAVGDRVEISPHTDQWMRGARFGVVVRTSITPNDRVHVKLDKIPGIVAGTEDTFRRI